MSPEVKIFSRSSPDVQNLLYEINDRSDNRKKTQFKRTRVPGLIISGHNSGRDRFIDITRFINEPCIDDIETLERIDSLSLTSPQKLLMFFISLPHLLSLEEAYEIVRDKDDRWFEQSYFFRPFTSDLINMVMKMRGLDLQEFSESEISFIFRSLNEEAEAESLDRLYRVNEFLEKAEEGESYQEFYQDSEKTLFDTPKADLNKIDVYPHTKNLFTSFKEVLAGAMNHEVDKGVLNRLKEISRDDYSKLLKRNKGVSGQKLDVLENLLRETELVEVRSVKENQEIFYDLILRKALKSEKTNILDFVSVLAEDFSYHPYDDRSTLSDQMRRDKSRLADILRENSESLSISQMIALKVAYDHHSVWIRTGSEESRSFLFFNLLEESPVGLASIFEYLLFENEMRPPTMTQWKKSLKDDSIDIFEVPPSLALEFINDRATLKNASMKPMESVERLRSYYKEGMFG